MRAEVPSSVHTRDGDVDRVLEPFRDPVHGKGDKDNQTNHLALTTAATGSVARRRRLPPSIDGHQCHRVPRTKRRGNQPSDKAHQVDVAILLAHGNTRLQHQRREGNPRDPCVKGKHQEEGKDGEHNGGTPVASPEVEGSRTDGEDDVQNTRDPDELLGEYAGKPDVRIGEDDGHGENATKEDHSTRVECEGVTPVVDSSAIDISGLRVSEQRDGRHGDKAAEDEDELETTSASNHISHWFLCRAREWDVAKA